eukprot:8822795-Lingulodinium_polyedra.AAC.1
MPMRSCDFWRLTAEHVTRTVRGNHEKGIWACPCCARRWKWGVGGAKRVFAIRVGNKWRLAYIGSANADDPAAQTLYQD